MGGGFVGWRNVNPIGGICRVFLILVGKGEGGGSGIFTYPSHYNYERYFDHKNG